MHSTVSDLKEKAVDIFDPSFAAHVQEEIDREVSQAQAQPPGNVDRGLAPYALAATQLLADAFYSRLKPGKLSGRFSVQWNGMDSFVYIPDQDEPLTYRTSAGQSIVPGTMYTDGGSIPRILRGLKKFSSWGYAPAFMIHDWLFTARKCGYATDVDWSFPDSARIMAEVMKSLMEDGFVNFAGERVALNKAEDTLFLMYLAVRSPIAKSLWNSTEKIPCVP